jgi:hypothetical protein
MREWKTMKVFTFTYCSIAHKDTVQLVTLDTECLQNATTKDYTLDKKREDSKYIPRKESKKRISKSDKG